MMQANRLGLPRAFIQEIATDLGACSIDVDESCVTCTHKPECAGCRKFCFAALHKRGSSLPCTGAAGAEWELALWQDSSLIISYSNFFSSSRCGLLTRGSAGARDSYNVWAPEAIWHYNVQGRSATDGADQLRKKICLAERRIKRVGNKGISFVFDLAFTNASIMWAFMQPASTPRWKIEAEYTKVCCSACALCLALYVCLSDIAVHAALLVHRLNSCWSGQTPSSSSPALCVSAAWGASAGAT